MWPFKRMPKLSLEEWAAQKPPAPCNNQKGHYFWTEIEGWPCPTCAAIEKRKKNDAEEDRLAEKIAQKVAALMKGSTLPGVTLEDLSVTVNSGGTSTPLVAPELSLAAYRNKVIEECAALCDERSKYFNRAAAEQYEAEDCASAIRAMKEQP